MIRKNIAINKATLMRIWRQFQAEPEKPFILADFKGAGFVHRGYLEIFVSLGLVEECAVTYKYGAKDHSHKDVKGYKLITKKIPREKTSSRRITR